MMWFYNSGLPELLQRKLPLGGCEIRPSGSLTVDVEIKVESETGPVSAAYHDLPMPDDSGVFHIGDCRLVVVPISETEELDAGNILCVGKQLLADLEDRIGSAPAAIELDSDLIRRLVHLEQPIPGFLESTGQVLDDTNCYARTTHLRRLINVNFQKVLPDYHIGRVCPIDTPIDRPGLPLNTGKILTISRGAALENDRLVIHSDETVDRLGPVAATIPFLEHTESIRAQIGVNHMRQWRKSSEPEPALVQTGLEPDDPDFWIGHDLLTAYTSLGKYTFEDSLVMSESAASRIGFSPHGGIGTKLSNRNGQKGVISAVLPDGTAVEVVVSFIGLHTRMNCGQLYEAAASWTVRETGKPFIAAPFSHAAEKIGNELSKTPYLCRLKLGEKGQETDFEILVGWVYWGVNTIHAENRLLVSSKTGIEGCMQQGEMESHVLIRCGAFRILQERLTKLAAEKRDDSPWSVLFDTIKRRLSTAGIRVKADKSRLAFEIAEPEGDVLHLAAPLAHPWLPERTIEVVGNDREVEGWEELNRVNSAVSDASHLSKGLRSRQIDRLQNRLNAYFSNLLIRLDLCLGSRVRRSARGMITVGAVLEYDQVGIPRRMSQELFNGEKPPEWVVINRAPTMEGTAVTAFKPVIVDGEAIQLNPYVCRWFNADFDGDQVAVLVPDSPETREEAGRLLSVVGHVSAESRYLGTLAPTQEAMWGLARQWLSSEGRRELRKTLPTIKIPDGTLTREHLVDALQEYLKKNGAVPAIEKTVELWERGFDEAMRAGGTLNPFSMIETPLPGKPDSDDRESWDRHLEHCVQVLASVEDFENPGFGAQLLAARTGARGTDSNIAYLVFGRGFLEDGQGRQSVIQVSRILDAFSPRGCMLSPGRCARTTSASCSPEPLRPKRWIRCPTQSPGCSSACCHWTRNRSDHGC